MRDYNPKLKIYVVFNGIYEQRFVRINTALANNLAQPHPKSLCACAKQAGESFNVFAFWHNAR